MSKVEINTNGTPQGTIIIIDGEIINSVKKLILEIDANKPFSTLTLITINDRISFTGELMEVKE